jgi:hypothetical protein
LGWGCSNYAKTQGLCILGTFESIYCYVNAKLVFLLFRRREYRIVNLDRGLPLAERLQRIDHIQARRFSKLIGTVLEIATEGIIRHLAACDRMDVNPDISAVREIIDDALNGRRVYAEAAEITRAA